MAYEKQIFKDGETLTAEQLNHIEDGIVALENEIENGGGGGSAEGAVLYTEQTPTPEQQAQARENIGAVGIDEVEGLLGEGSFQPTEVCSGGHSISGGYLKVIVYTDGFVRAVPNPCGIVCKKGVTYKLSRSSNNYKFAFGVFKLTSARDDFTVNPEVGGSYDFPEAKEKIFDSSWVASSEFEYTAKDDNLLIAPMFNWGEQTFTEEMLNEVKNTFSITWEKTKPKAVLYTEQTLTEEEKAQARANIGAAAEVQELTAVQVQKCKEYAMRVNEATGDVEAFVFFTDPHYGRAEDMRPFMESHLQQISKVYHHTPTSMCVCGGDWLNNGNTKENACWQLGVYDGRMKELFDRYVMIIGNHDNNYQGYEYMQSGLDGEYDVEASEQCILSKEIMRNLWHRKQGASYFVVDGDNTTFYVFDTGLDWYSDMDDYRWEQISWFANKLLADKPERCAALVHIAETSTPFIDAITKVANAYNAKSSVTLNGVTYNFSEATGKFYFVLGGHSHADRNMVANNIPIMTTINADVDENTATFDLVLVDYATNQMHMVRVGTGNSRTLALAE